MADNQEIKIKVTVDTASAEKKIDKFKKEVEQTATSANKAATGMNTLKTAANGFGTNLTAQTQAANKALNNLGTSSKSASKTLQESLGSVKIGNGISKQVSAIQASLAGLGTISMAGMGTTGVASMGAVGAAGVKAAKAISSGFDVAASDISADMGTAAINIQKQLGGIKLGQDFQTGHMIEGFAKVEQQLTRIASRMRSVGEAISDEMTKAAGAIMNFAREIDKTNAPMNKMAKEKNVFDSLQLTSEKLTQKISQLRKETKKLDKEITEAFDTEDKAYISKMWEEAQASLVEYENRLKQVDRLQQAAVRSMTGTQAQGQFNKNFVPNELNAAYMTEPRISAAKLKRNSDTAATTAEAAAATAATAANNRLSQSINTVHHAATKLDRSMGNLTIQNNRFRSASRSLSSVFTGLKSNMAKINPALKKVGESAKQVVNKFNKFGTAVRKVAMMPLNGLSNISKKIQHIGKSADKAKNKVGGLGKVIRMLTLGFGFYQAVNFAKSCVELGSSINEVQNVVDTAFPTMSSQIDSWAKNASKQFGLSELQAKQYSSTLAVMVQSMGLTEQAAAKMATDLAGLAGDISSFYNITQDEAYTKIQSAITGETEAIKSLGVVMTQANLQQYAYSQGIRTSIQNLDQASLVSLRYSYIMDSLNKAQGDFNKTSGSYANQVRLLSNQWASFKANIGAGFVAAITPILQALNKLMGYLVIASEYVKAFFEMLFGKQSGASKGVEIPVTVGGDDVSDYGASSGGTGDGVDTTGQIADNMGTAADNAEKMAETLEGLAGIDQINNLTKATQGGSGGSAGGSGGSGGSGAGGGSFSTGGGVSFGDIATGELDVSGVEKGLSKLKKMFGDFINSLPKLRFDVDWNLVKNNIIKGLKGIGKALLNYLHMALTISILILNDIGLDRLIEKCSGVFRAFGELQEVISDALCPALINLYKEGISPIYQWLGDKLADALDTITSIMDDWAGWFTTNNDKIAKFGTTIGKVTNAIWKLIKPIANSAWRIFKGIIVMISDTMQGLFSIILQHQDGIQAFADVFSMVVQPLSNVVAAIADTAWDVFKTVLEKIGVALGASLGWILDHGNEVAIILALISGGAIAGIILLWNKCEGFRQFFIDMWAQIQPVVEQAWTAISGFFISAWDTISSVWDTVVQPYFTAIWDGIKGVFSSVADVLGGFFSDAWDAIKVVWDAAAEFFGMVWAAIKLVFSVVGTVLGGFFRVAWITIQNIWNKVKPYFKAVWDGIKGVFSVVGTVLGGFFKGAWKIIKSVFSNNIIISYFKAIWTGIKGIFSVVKNVLSGDFSGAWNAIKETWNKVKGYFGDIWQGIKDIFSGVADWFGGIFGGAAEAIVGAFRSLPDILKAPINAVIDLFNNSLGSINVTIPDWVPGIGGNSFGIPKIPRLAQGGVVDSATLFQAGENGREVVMPLEHNTGWMKKVGQEIAHELGISGGLGGNNDRPIELTVKIGNTTLAKEIIKAGKEHKRQTGNSILYSL